MPRRDGTGPQDGGAGMGMGRGKGGQGKGRRGGTGTGAGGTCICPKCGLVVTHEAGNPCSWENCPQCGSSMVRKRV
jgi:hypothetical protein